MSNQTMDQLLDGTIDDLKDKPEFKAFPIGVHRLKFTFEPKTIDGTGTGVQINLVALETIELADDKKDVPLEIGAKTNVFLFFTHENETVVQFGQGTFKMMMAVLADKFGPASNRKLMEQANGGEGLFVTGQRSNKDKSQTFTSIEDFKMI